MVNYCEFSGKQCFDSRQDAEKALRNQRLRKNRGSVYFCEKCKTYHISSIPYHGSKNIQVLKKKHIKGY